MRVKRSRIPTRFRLVRNPDEWVVKGHYERFWPNGDSCWVDLAGGETRRSAVWRSVRGVAGNLR